MLNPGTPVEALDYILEDVDLVLVMSVNSASAGRASSIRSCEVEAIRKRIDALGKPIHLEVDGGVNAETARLCLDAGADVLVAGLATFKGGPEQYAANIAALKGGRTGARTLLREDAGAAEDMVAPALPLNDGAEPLVAEVPQELPEVVPLEPARALVLADFQPPRAGPVDSVVRWAYRLGVPGSVLAAPLRKPTPPRLLATVASPLEGERAAGMALRAGQFLVHGLKVPIDKVEFTSNAPLTPPVQRVVQGFTLRDLGACPARGMRGCG